MWTGHRKEIRKLTFRALALCRNVSLRRTTGAKNSLSAKLIYEKLSVDPTFLMQKLFNSIGGMHMQI